ncbi:RidA family protein [Sphingomonas crocodyli]|uniref:RidA family protein n=1 Tax=Sphingomonas crocodyli TaxID=1979270 RepID=A0A437M6Z3_9SPHN|nr:RidA family protein [Sphingomonas crocodyli]RVT93491.1 RidA family protein [Sphingomonas crocodyli]
MSEIIRMDGEARGSRVVIHNGIVYLAGVTAPDREQDIGGQTTQVLDRIDAYLERAGTDKTRLLTAQIWLRDIERDFAGMNAVWDHWTAPHASPTRATVQSSMASTPTLVEIVVTAALP